MQNTFLRVSCHIRQSDTRPVKQLRDSGRRSLVLMDDHVCDAYNMLMVTVIISCSLASVFVIALFTFMIAGRKIAEYKWVFDAGFGIGRPLRNEINTKCQQLRTSEIDAVNSMNYGKAARLVNLRHALRIQESRAKQYSNEEKQYVGDARDGCGDLSELESKYRLAELARNNFKKAVAEMMSTLQHAQNEIEGKPPTPAVGVPVALNLR